MFVRKKTLIILSLIFFIVAVTFLILGFKAQQRPVSFAPSIDNQNQIQKIVKKTYPADLKGKIYLSLLNKDTQNRGIYYLDLALGELKEVHVSQNCIVVGGGMDSTGSKMAVSSNCETENSTVFQIYASDINKNSTAITKSLTDFKKEAVWSPDNKRIAFSVASPEAKNDPDPALNIHTWDIFTSDLEGNEQFVANAVHPFFSPDGKKILALRKQGLFLFNVETGEGELVYTFETDMQASMHLGLSDQKDQLAVSDPYDRSITIFKIKSWDTFEMEETQRIETENSYASWPKFAPDGQKYLITQDVFDDQSVKIVAYNLETKERHFVFDLSEYIDANMWINDWK